MTPQKLEKIRALAEDKRGDPSTRAIAQAILKRYGKPEDVYPTKKDIPRVDPRVHGLRRDPLYEHYVYTDLAQWDKTKAGNPTYMLYHKGISWRIVLFQYKRGGTYGWMRINTDDDTSEFSGRFATIDEAQRAAWVNLMTTI